MNTGFVGLGKMGSGMAHNLLKAGNQVYVYNRSREKAEAFAKQNGGTVAASPAEAARKAEIVFSMLADDNALASVLFGDDGILAGLREGAVHVSSSTISTAFARKMAEEHAQRKQILVSSPVFGRPDAAEAKRLIVLAAGDRTAIERCRPLLDAIGRQTFLVGSEPWQANVLKLCGNFMIASMLEAFGEAFAVMRKSEVDPHTFLDIMNELFGSPVYKNYGTTVLEEKFEPAGFALKLGLKDVRQALEAAAEVSAPMPLGSVLRDSFLNAMANGQEQMDWSSLALVAARNAGLQTKQARP